MKNYRQWLKDLLREGSISYEEYKSMLSNYEPGDGSFKGELEAIRNK